MDWEIILKKMTELATSDLAKTKLKNLEPLKSPELALKSFMQIEEVMSILETEKRSSMESLDAYSIWLRRLSKKAVLRPVELKDVRHFCIEIIDFKQILRSYKGTWVDGQKSILMDAQKPLSAIDHIMFPDGGIRTDASEKLYESHREKSQLTQSIQKTLDRIVKNHHLEPVLQDRYVTNRQGRWVLPIKSGMRHNFHGIIHASSQSQKTVFMEPNEVVPLNNRLKQVDSEIEEEVDRLLTELSSYLYGLLSELERSKDLLLEGDILFAKAQFSANIRAKACKFHSKHCQLIHLRHPLLELSEGSIVPNTVQLDSNNRILLLSGPNAGGKTVLLKSFGLAAHMARCGLLICADSRSRIPFFKKIFVNVGDSQSMEDQLSTFVAHLKQLTEAVVLAKGEEFLVLVDEICSATDPEEGSALARSFIYQLAEQKCFSIVTSHLGQLKKGWEPGMGVVNGSLEFRVGQGPTYQFFMGIPGQSLAIQTAQQVNVPPLIIERAMKFLSPEYKRNQKEANELGHLRKQLQQTKDRLDREQKTLSRKLRKYENLLDKFQNERESMLDQVQKRAERRVAEWMQHAKEKGIFYKHMEIKEVKGQISKIIRVHSKTRKASQKILSSVEEVKRTFPSGSKVYVNAIQQNAIIQGEPNSRGEVPILAGSMRIMVPWHCLQFPQKSFPRSLQPSFLKEESYEYKSLDGTIDLRGQNVSEALKLMEEYLDKAFLNQKNRVKVIHGHGIEETLKCSVRNYLSRSKYVKKWNSGIHQNDGDGVTWVFLKE